MCDLWLHGLLPTFVIAPNLADASDSFDVHRHRQSGRFCAVYSRRLARELGSDGCWSADKPAAAAAEAVITQTRRVFCSSSSRCTVDCNVAWASSCVHWCVTPPPLHCTALLLSRVLDQWPRRIVQETINFAQLSSSYRTSKNIPMSQKDYPITIFITFFTVKFRNEL